MVGRNFGLGNFPLIFEIKYENLYSFIRANNGNILKCSIHSEKMSSNDDLGFSGTRQRNNLLPNKLCIAFHCKVVFHYT